ncbi:MAG: hypothetical protein GXP26_08670 [Planctomycetes bacterium]|nr:hypothetical protein [Planctomycetota bacterium]
MVERSSGVEADRQLLMDAQARGPLATTMAYAKLSGPGWLQSAVTLGGGSLASSLYLGVLGGMSLLWVQPVAMVLGIIMLSSIGYVTLSTGKRPFQAINEHVNPVLGWGWALATLVANIVWCLPQFSLANVVLQQNLLPELLGREALIDPTSDKIAITAIILVVTILVTWSYSSRGLGVKLYEALLKLLVAMVVLCFVGVLFALRNSLEWGEIFAGFIPNPGQIFEPASAFIPYLDAISEEHRAFWTNKIVSNQRDVLISAAATAVGINMTFLFPYSLLKRGWTKEFRGLVAFDLATGMLIPFLLATSCVVIASASQFHTTPVPGLVEAAETESGEPVVPTDKERAGFRANLLSRVKQEVSEEQYKSLVAAMKEKNYDLVDSQIEKLPKEERLVGAMLVKRDAGALASTIAPLVGKRVANLLFGVGVLGMALSTITMLMTISGFVICEMIGCKPEGWAFRLSSLAGAAGALGPFVWSKAAFALAVPTSVFGLILLPVAYLTFFLLMNQKKVLGDQLPRGGKRVVWNLLMALSAGIASTASIWMVWLKAGVWGMLAIGLFLGLALVVQFRRRETPSVVAEEG